MNLTDEHIDILKQARHLIESDEEQFICHAVYVKGLDGRDSLIRKRLQKHIQACCISFDPIDLTQRCTLPAWAWNNYSRHTGTYPDYPVAAMMRLAWIDKMIATGEIN